MQLAFSLLRSRYQGRHSSRNAPPHSEERCVTSDDPNNGCEGDQLALGWPAIVLSAFSYLSWPSLLNIVVTVQQQSRVVFHQSHILPPSPPSPRTHTRTHPETPALCEYQGMAQFIVRHYIERGVAIIFTSKHVTSMPLPGNNSACVSFQRGDKHLLFSQNMSRNACPTFLFPVCQTCDRVEPTIKPRQRNCGTENLTFDLLQPTTKGKWLVLLFVFFVSCEKHGTHKKWDKLLLRSDRRERAAT